MKRLAEAHTSLAWAQFHDWDWAGAEKEFRRAIELDPRYASAHLWYGEYLTARGRFDEALAEMSRAQELDPMSPAINLALGYRILLRAPISAGGRADARKRWPRSRHSCPRTCCWARV